MSKTLLLGVTFEGRGEELFVDHGFGERAPMPANRRSFGCAQDRRGSRLRWESVIY